MKKEKSDIKKLEFPPVEDDELLEIIQDLGKKF